MLRGLEQVERNLDLWYQGRLATLRRAMEEIAAVLEAYAKTNHPWTSRTSHTVQSIRGQIGEATRDYIKVYLSAGMDYDVFLELAREGKWAWLFPAVEANVDKIKQILASALKQAGVEPYPVIGLNVGIGLEGEPGE
jgi:hypothetical protein